VGEDLPALEGQVRVAMSSRIVWKELTSERMSNGIELKCCSAPFLPRTRASGFALLVLARARFFAGAEAVKSPNYQLPLTLARQSLSPRQTHWLQSPV
jgi:hypothetical protein